MSHGFVNRVFKNIKSSQEQLRRPVYRELRFGWVVSNWRTEVWTALLRRLDEKGRKEIWIEARGGRGKILVLDVRGLRIYFGRGEEKQPVDWERCRSERGKDD